jgi:hypothetical protein
VTFDAERAERAVKMLKELAREFQIIFMTASDRYDAAADNVVVLSAPTERDEPEPAIAPSGGEAISMWATENGNGNGSGNGPRAPANGNPRPAPVAAPVPARPVAPLWPEER